MFPEDRKSEKAIGTHLGKGDVLALHFREGCEANRSMKLLKSSHSFVKYKRRINQE